MNREVIKLQEEIKRDIRTMEIYAKAGKIGCGVAIALAIMVLI